ncbi:MAG: glycoside hydrolase family 38 C-terminal domain-containing protein [Phycisphaerae bacterium]
MDNRVIQKKLQTLEEHSTLFLFPLESWQVRTAEFLGPERYKFDGDWKDVSLPSAWAAGKTVFLRCKVRVPERLPKGDVYWSFKYEMLEGLMSIDGQPYCGIDKFHDRVKIPRTTQFDLSLEFMSVPDIYHQPQLKDTKGTLYGVFITIIDPVIEGAYYDIKFAWEASQVVKDQRRKRLLEEAVEKSILAIDLTLPRDRLIIEVQASRKILKENIGQIASDPEAGRLFLAGHTHIDTAWLWPIRETVRKCGRTFSTSCRLMEQYPDFYFSCSQAQLYKYTQKYYPDVYRQIKKWVKKGRWETTGAMWVEADCNVTSGESLIRQILYGLDFYRREFGTRPRTCWLPDVFGYPATLPEILKGCGVDYFYTNKLHWQSQNPFPYHLFRWRGLDGSEVIAHIPKLPNYYLGLPSPEQFSTSWDNYLQKTEYPEVLFPYGHGDGGGGPTTGMLEVIARGKKFPGLPTLRNGLSQQYFDDLVKQNPDLPVWDGELYLETHQGTYTTQGIIKRTNRKTELLLREAEIFGSFAQTQGGKFNAETLRSAWETTLLHQFHDILPGSSIGQVYKETLGELVKVKEIAEDVIEESLSILMPEKMKKGEERIVVFNSLSWARNDAVVATVPDYGDDVCVCSTEGESYPTQILKRAKGKTTIAFVPDQIPPMGYAVYSLVNQRNRENSQLKVSSSRIQSPYYCLELTRQGAISRLLDKQNQRELVSQGVVANDLQLLQDGPELEDAWNIFPTLDKRRYAFEGKTTLKVMEEGSVRGVVRINRTHRGSTFVQDIIVYTHSPRIDFVTHVDWHEKSTMLKVAFPLEIRTMRATFEVQFGALERPTHRNTSWDRSKFEVCGQRWADISEAGYGVSLLNDCKYGYDVYDNILRLTLLRSTIYPDPKADEGQHEFTYSLLPHRGDWWQGQTVRSALELNVPVRSQVKKMAPTGLPKKSFITLMGLPAVVETFKVAEDGRGYILRIYEPHGSRGTATIKTELPIKQVIECNLVEEDKGKVISDNGKFDVILKPFSIKTFRLLV